LHIDHDNAKFLAEELARMPGIRLGSAQVQTNIVIYDVSATGLSANNFLAELARRGVLGVPLDQERIRMVTHLDVDRSGVEKAAATIRQFVDELNIKRAGHRRAT
jgi:threonine aldolase